MRRPARSARDREDRRKGLARDGERIEQDRREEFDIGLDRTVWVLPPQRLADISLDLARKGKVGAIGFEPLDRCLEYISAGIAHPIDAVAKSHQALAAPERIIDPGLDALAGADRIEHFQHWLRG